MNSLGCKGIISKLESELIKHAMEDKCYYMNTGGKAVVQEKPLDFWFRIMFMTSSFVP